MGVKSRFVGYGDGAACTVESLVLQHLSQPEEGSWAGWHCEGSPLRALWALLMWDVIFSPVADVFQVFTASRSLFSFWVCRVVVILMANVALLLVHALRCFNVWAREGGKQCRRGTLLHIAAHP